jgi:hypothetical protein
MERSGSTLTFRMGQDAENVKSVYFSILGNPSVFVGLTGSDASITMNEPGVALVRVSVDRSIQAGEILTTLSPTLS